MISDSQNSCSWTFHCSKDLVVEVDPRDCGVLLRCKEVASIRGPPVSGFRAMASRV